MNWLILPFLCVILLTLICSSRVELVRTTTLCFLINSSVRSPVSYTIRSSTFCQNVFVFFSTTFKKIFYVCWFSCGLNTFLLLLILMVILSLELTRVPDRNIFLIKCGTNTYFINYEVMLDEHSFPFSTSFTTKYLIMTSCCNCSLSMMQHHCC